MYTDEERNGVPIKTFIISLILIILFILLLMWLLPIPKSSNNDSNNSNNSSQGNITGEFPNINGLLNRIFIDNVDSMKNAATSYFTTDKLPEKVGESKTLTLQEMLDSHLLLPFTDKDGKSCNNTASYVTLTKLNDSYQMKVNLKCGEEEAYILVPMGCYSYCTGAICQNKEQTTKYVQVSTSETIVDNKGDEVITKTSPKCVLYVSEGTLGDNSWYKSDVVVKFKSKYATTGGSTITSYGLGTQANATYNGQDSYTVNTDGTTTIYGYVQDSNGYTGTCSINVKKDTVKPNCDLAVLSGTKAANGIYTSNITVGFTTKTDATSGILNYGMSNTTTVLYNKISRFNIISDGTHKVYGYVIDKAGNTATCDLTVKREKVNTTDPTPEPTPTTSTPSCSLKIVEGTSGLNGWYLSNVVVGFASKTSTNNATITSYGLGFNETYNGNNTYTINNDGITTIYGYVKDSNGYIGTCSLTVKKDTVKPDCTLKVTNGTYKDGYYTSNVVVGFASKTDTTSNIINYGIEKTKTYNKKTTYTISSKGLTTVYGYVQDYAGNENVCSIKVEIKDNLEYEYKKDIESQYSAWSPWTTSTYSPSNPPKFGKYALIEIVDLGKTQEIDYYKESTGEAFYRYVPVKVGTTTEKYCTGYDYYREKTTSVTTAVKKGTSWNFVGMVTTSSVPSDTLSVKYEFVGFDWKCTGCERMPRYIWNKYNRTTYEVKSIENMETKSGVKAECSGYETKTIEVYDTVKVFVDYQIIKTPVYKDVYRYQKRTRTLLNNAYVDYVWSYYNNESLLNNGYSYTGNTRSIG